MYLISSSNVKKISRMEPPPVDEAAEKTISDYLRSWGLEAYIPKFLEESIDVETLQMLSEADLKDLVPIIGHRAKLTTQIKLLTNIMSNAFENTCANTTPDSNNQIMLYTVEDLPVVQTLPDDEDPPEMSETINEIEEDKPEYDCELYGILSSSNEGKGLLLQYQEKGLLNNAARRRLCNLIITHELKNDAEKKIPSSRFYQLAYEISKIFKQESSSVYFIPYASFSPLQKTSAKGKLLDQYRQRRRDFIKSGIIKSFERRCSSSSSNSNEQYSPRPSTSAQEAISHLEGSKSVNISEKLLWLQNNCDPWQMVESYWEVTTKERLNDLASKNMTISNYFTKYKAINLSGGIYLLLKDFKIMYPDYGDKFNENWPLIKSKLISIAKKKGLINEIDESNEEQTDLAALTSLPFLMSTSNVTSTKKATKKTHWRPSKREVLEGFITQVASPAEVAVEITRKRDKLMKMDLQMQPFVIAVVSPNESITARYIVINNITYEMPTITKAVEACLKAIFVLNAEYPKESRHVWQFVQTVLFELKTKYDKSFTAVNTLISDLGIKT
ncbi:uncharacterized protein LOC111360505 isoform X1 [Spodoptera litura]|uniref:Uncharacterized protein LOC111360505 isoform X1 n=1 Tax=Spodoptera litura TaxID=69820 RepID=A0A9J7EK86_SPOLT|nr:uncharacterized protein LOC111360505 isoform X1 [Spodoptera litura]